MHSDQAEIQRIQTKLQTIGHQRRQTRQPSRGDLAVADLAAFTPALPSRRELGEREANRRDVNNAGIRQLRRAIASPISTASHPALAPYPSRLPKFSGAAPADLKADVLDRSPSAPSSAADAAQLADRLRRQYRSLPQQNAKADLQSGPAYLLRWGKRFGQSLQSPLPSQPPAASGTPRQLASSSERTAASADLTLQDAVLWIAASAAVRVGLDLLLVTYSGLWLPIVALIVAPAAIALYRTAINPDAGFVLGRRLLLIMIGLLLGGQVF